ncbi:MAG: DUF4238 domain-containing protein [Chloroflexi bacterium]|nr:DUF4238 domain-containing protein [Chloroflexota bacterium]
MTADTGKGVETPYSASQRVVFARHGRDMTIATLVTPFKAVLSVSRSVAYEARIATLERRIAELEQRICELERHSNIERGIWKHVSNPKRQHYIPQMLLKHFVDDKNQLWFFEQDTSKTRVEKRNIKSTFRKKNVYTFTNPDGSRDYSTENSLSELESAADPVVCKIVEHARDGKPPSLTLDEREVWDWFFVTLSKRSPDEAAQLISGLLEDEDMQRMYRKRWGMAEAESINREAMGKFLQNEIWPRSFQEKWNKALSSLSGMKLWVTVSSKGQDGLIVGSNPVIRAGGHLNDPGTELILALAHDVAVSFNHKQGGVGELSGEYVHYFNRVVFNQSTKVAGRSKQQLESLRRFA